MNVFIFQSKMTDNVNDGIARKKTGELFLRRLLVWVLAASLFADLTGCSRHKVVIEPPPQVELSTGYPEVGVPLLYTVSGSVVSDHRVDVSSKLVGYIREITVQEGDSVYAGQILAVIDGSDVDGAIRQAQALTTASELAFRDAEIDYDKFKILFERGSISENEMRKIRLKYEAARETVNQARAGLDTALSLKAYSEVKSPVDGIVVARIKRIGDMALPGFPILQVEEPRQLVFETYVAEGQIGNLKAGQPVNIAVDRVASPIRGSISRIVLSGDPVTRSYLVKVTLPDDQNLMPGMYGRACFVVGESRTLTVARSALVERGGLNGIYVIDAQNAARFRWVRVGREWPDRVEVTSGLSALDRIALSAPNSLSEGAVVRELSR